MESFVRWDLFFCCLILMCALVITYNLRRYRVNWCSDSLVSVLLGFMLGLLLKLFGPGEELMDFAFDEQVHSCTCFTCACGARGKHTRTYL